MRQNCSYIVDYASAYLAAVPFASFNGAPAEQIEHQLRWADATLVVTQEAFLDRAFDSQQ